MHEGKIKEKWMIEFWSSHENNTFLFKAGDIL